MDRRAIGRSAEDAAASFLEAQGLCIVLRNFTRRCGELDLVARDAQTLVIAEVRLRAGGTAAESVDWIKRRRITRTARLLLLAHPELAKLRVRFDVLAISGQAPDGAIAPARIEWIRHAFEAA